MIYIIYLIQKRIIKKIKTNITYILIKKRIIFYLRYLLFIIIRVDTKKFGNNNFFSWIILLAYESKTNKECFK